jgi:peptide-methionine (S)-S-oxide reductase
VQGALRPQDHRLPKYRPSHPALIYIFLHLHDPTTLNRQGNDSGTQYRSIILYEKGSEDQQALAVKTIQEVAAEGKYPGFPDKIVTEVRPLEEFYPA